MSMSMASGAHLHVLDLDEADDKVLQVLVLDQRDLQPLVHHLRGAGRVGPVALALDLAALHLLGHHGDDVGLLLPHHLPEVSQRGGQRALAGDERVAFVLHRHGDEVGVDVAAVLAQGDPRRVDWRGKD